MYPAGELKRLELRKALLQLRIAERRLQCAIAAREEAQPLRTVDRALDLWRRVPPVAKLVAIPVVLMLARKLAKRKGLIGSVARMTPMVMSVARAVGGRPMTPV